MALPPFRCTAVLEYPHWETRLLITRQNCECDKKWLINKNIFRIFVFQNSIMCFAFTVCCCVVRQSQKQHRWPVDQAMGNTFWCTWPNPEPFESQPNRSLHCSPLASLHEDQPFRTTIGSTAISPIWHSFPDDPRIRFHCEFFHSAISQKSKKNYILNNKVKFWSGENCDEKSLQLGFDSSFNWIKNPRIFKTKFNSTTMEVLKTYLIPFKPFVDFGA